VQFCQKIKTNSRRDARPASVRAGTLLTQMCLFCAVTMCLLPDEDLGDLSADQQRAIHNIAISPFLVQPLQADR
jgi:hypothetical protein